MRRLSAWACETFCERLGRVCLRPRRELQYLWHALQKVKKVKKGTPVRRTDGGNTRDVKIERIGPVTIYKRGEA